MSNTALRNKALHPIIIKILNIADQIIVPAPRPTFAQLNNAISEVNNSGALDPTAINVAHDTSSRNFRFFAISSKLTTK